MKRLFSRIGAAMISAALLLPQATSLAVCAEDTTALDSAADNALAGANVANTLPYQIWFEPERNYVTAEEVAAGDVVIPAKVYLTGSTRNHFTGATVKYDAFRNGEKSYDIYFTDLLTGNSSNRQDTETEYSSSIGTFSTDLLPYCFGSVTTSKILGTMYESNGSFYDSKTVSCPWTSANLNSLVSAGYGKVKFTASYYASAADFEAGQKTTKEFVCDVTVDENGTGTYTFEYADRTSNYQTATMTGTIPRYDPNTPEGESFPGSCNSLTWNASTSSLQTGATFLGNNSDEFPFFQVNIVVAQGTQPGVYDLRFLTKEDTGTAAPTQLVGLDNNGKTQEYSLECVTTSIAVGVDNIAVEEVRQDDADKVKFYTDDNTKAIRASDFSCKILAEVTYTDADGVTTTESGVDVTGLVNCNGTTPYNLYSQQATDGVFLSKNVPLYYRTNADAAKLLKWKSSGDNVTQYIMVGKKGDINYDGKVDPDDIYALLYYIAMDAVNLKSPLYQGNLTDENLERFTFYLADFDTCSTQGETDSAKLDSQDVYYLLLYTAYKGAALNISMHSFEN